MPAHTSLLRKTIVKLMAFTSLFILGCDGLLPDEEIYRPDHEPEPSVFSIISPDPRFEFVVVELTKRLNERDSQSAIVNDAMVHLMSATDTVRFTFFQDSTQCRFGGYCGGYREQGVYIDRDQAFQAQPGSSYALHVQLPDGRIVTGSARVPEIPKITTPLANSRIKQADRAQTLVSWRTSADTPGYDVDFLLMSNHHSSLPLDALALQEAVLAPPVSLESISDYYWQDPNDQWSEIAVIRVMAMDRNYYDYQQTTNNGLLELIGRDLNLLEGGVGVFGAVSFDSVNVILE